MSLINIISAIGDNSKVYPLIVRDCGIEAPAKLIQTWNQNEKTSRPMAKHAVRERGIEEYATSAVWLGGVPLVEMVANKIIRKKIGLNGDVNSKLFQKNKSNQFVDALQNVDINIEKFKTKAPEAVADLVKIKNGNEKIFKKLSNNKYVTAIALSIGLMGFVIPKANFALSNYLMKRDPDLQQPNKNKLAPLKSDTVEISMSNVAKNNEDINTKISKKFNQGTPSFKGLGEALATMSQTGKMAVTDAGLGVGRMATSRGRNEKIENGFRVFGMMFLNFVTPKYIERGLDAVSKKMFGINTALDPKIMADKRFLAKVRSGNLNLPMKETEVLDFIDNNPNSLLNKYAKQNKIVKFLPNKVRDPREYVDTKELFKLSESMKAFSEDFKLSGGKNLKKYANKAIKAKSFNVLANIAISCTLLAVGMPQAQYLLRRMISDSDVEPGLLSAQAGVNKEK